MNSNINNNLDYQIISDLNKAGVNIFDINDLFYNDRCNNQNVSNHDLILEDRIKDVYINNDGEYNNKKLCQNTCDFNSYDYSAACGV